MSSPRWRTVGLEVEAEVVVAEDVDIEAGGAIGGGGRPASCGVGVAADILGMQSCTELGGS